MCAAGTRESSKKFCLACNPGTHSVSVPGREGGSTQCADCDFGTANPSPQKAGHCDACEQGSYSDVLGGLRCINCPAGTKLINRKSPCVPCRPGSLTLANIKAERIIDNQQ